MVKFWTKSLTYLCPHEVKVEKFPIKWGISKWDRHHCPLQMIHFFRRSARYRKYYSLKSTFKKQKWHQAAPCIHYHQVAYYLCSKVVLFTFLSSKRPLQGAPLSVKENVLFPYKLHNPGKIDSNTADEMVESALRKVLLWDQIKDRLDHKATGLSLEEQQKLCIARLLPVKPSILWNSLNSM